MKNKLTRCFTGKTKMEQHQHTYPGNKRASQPRYDLDSSLQIIVHGTVSVDDDGDVTPDSQGALWLVEVRVGRRFYPHLIITDLVKYDDVCLKRDWSRVSHKKVVPASCLAKSWSGEWARPDVSDAYSSINPPDISPMKIIKRSRGLTRDCGVVVRCAVTLFDAT